MSFILCSDAEEIQKNMFDRKTHIETLKSIMKDWPLEKIESHADMMEKKHSKVKSGDNVVHLNHLSHIIDESDLEIIQQKLSTANYELSSYDTSGDVMASAEQFIKDIVIYLNQVTVKEAILLGLGTNAIWDAIKGSISFIYGKIKNKTFIRMSSATVTETRPTFIVTVMLNEDKTLEFSIDDVAEENIESAVDQINEKVIEFEKVDSNIPMVALYNAETKSWEYKSYTSEMLKKPSRVVRTLSTADYIKEIEAKEREQS